MGEIVENVGRVLGKKVSAPVTWRDLASAMEMVAEKQKELRARLDALDGGAAKAAKPRVKLPSLVEKRAGGISTVVKFVDETERVIEGIASTPRVDRSGDIVEPKGAEYKLPLPLLLDHNRNEQVGVVEYARSTPDGIKFRARINRVDEPGEVKELCDKAWHLVKNGLRSAVSIGFRPLDGGYEIMANGGLRFTAWEWLELSLVTIPAQPEAVITSVKGVPDA